jgi:glutamate-1-semialdehyde aminotransferase
VAAVILEPTVFEAPLPGFLEELRALCTARGILLIFDEMWTGFRLALGGAQERFKVTADLACFSKALANGMPLSALTGRAEVMRLLADDVFFFTTFGGEALSLAAAKATLGELARQDVPGYLDALGSTLRDGYNELCLDMGVAFTRCVGFPARTMVLFEPVGLAQGTDPLVMKSFVQQELIRCGVLWNGFHNLSLAHRSDDVSYLLGAYREALGLLRDALATNTLATRLRGEPMRPAFRRTSAFNTKPAPTGAGEQRNLSK